MVGRWRGDKSGNHESHEIHEKKHMIETNQERVEREFLKEIDNRYVEHSFHIQFLSINRKAAKTGNGWSLPWK